MFTYCSFLASSQPSCPTVTNMQQAMDNLIFDLLDFDEQHKVFPINACPFIVHLAGIPIPIDTVPTFNNQFSSRLGTMSDFEAVAFYSDFTQLVNKRTMTSALQNQLMGYFEIAFITDPIIDLLCAEALSDQVASTSTKMKTPYVSEVKSGKRAKHYNKPIISATCNNCTDTELRFKLIKKLTRCSSEDLHRYNDLLCTLKSEKQLMATLPPLHERDALLNQELNTLYQERSQTESHFLHELIPECIDRIKTTWYERFAVSSRTSFSVPDTDSDSLR